MAAYKCGAFFSSAFSLSKSLGKDDIPNITTNWFLGTLLHFFFKKILLPIAVICNQMGDAKGDQEEVLTEAVGQGEVFFKAY